MKKAVLSKRLQMLADMVTPGNRLVDVGCDHGWLSIYLVQQKICPGALAMDVRKGPLAGAEAHIQEFGLGDYIELRLSDGLDAYGAGEADTLVIAGMGGRLMEKILMEGMDKINKTGRIKELILQPQSELPQFRKFLREAGFAVTKEGAVREEGKYYFAMKAAPAEAGRRNMGSADSGEKESAGMEDEETAAGREEIQTLYDEFGELLLRRRHPALMEYLQQRISYLERLDGQLAKENSKKAQRRRDELGRELARTKKALLLYEGKNIL